MFRWGLRFYLPGSRSCTPLVFAFWGTGLLNVDCGAHFFWKSRAPDKSCSSSTTSHPESINNFSQKTSFRLDVKSLTWWSWWVLESEIFWRKRHYSISSDNRKYNYNDKDNSWQEPWLTNWCFFQLVSESFQREVVKDQRLKRLRWSWWSGTVPLLLLLLVE